MLLISPTRGIVMDNTFNNRELQKSGSIDIMARDIEICCEKNIPDALSVGDVLDI